METSSQDGSTGKQASPHATTGLELDLKTNNTQNHQKIELYGSLTTKDLKKPHSSRRVGGAEMWRGAERCRHEVWRGEVVAVEQAVPHSCVVDKNQEGYLGAGKPQAGQHSPGLLCHEDKSP